MNKMNISFSGLERNARGVKVRFAVMGKGELAGFEIATCTSGYAFPSYGAALKGARRALDTVNRTGKLPNMCERF
jgi:hypothetical protein